MPHVSVNDISMYYKQKGIGEPLFLINGLSSNHKTWDLMEEDLGQHFTVIMPDNRGAGRTTQPKELYTIDQMANDIAELMDSLEIESAHMLGHSMGGCIVQKICLDFPAKVKSAIIAGSAAKMPETFKYQMKTNIKLIEAGIDFKLCINNVIPWLFASGFLRNEKKLQDELRRLLEEPDIQTFEGYVGQVNALQVFDVSNEVHNIKQKLLVLCGADDLLMPEKYQHHLKDKIPHAEYEVMENCGHMFQREKPKEFIDLILKFLS